MNMSKPVVIIFGRVTSGVHYHRLIAPFFAMRDKVDVYLFQHLNQNSVPADILNKATHIVISRINTFMPIDNIKAFSEVIRSSGRKIIVDVDDWWFFPPDHPNREDWLKHEHERRAIKTMTHADEVWCTGKHLAKKIKRYNKNVHVVPNAVDTNSMQWNAPKIKSDKVRFGYIGGHYHQKDLKMTGLDLSSYESYAVDIGGYPEILNTRYKLSHEPPNRYGLLYSSIDVSLAPLIGSEFASCKSNLKLIEAAYTNTAVIASPVKPYKEHLEAGVNCLIATDDWKEKVEFLDDPLYQYYTAAKLRESMSEFSMDKVNEIRLNRLYS